MRARWNARSAAWSRIRRALADGPDRLAGVSAIVEPFALLALERERAAQWAPGGDGQSFPPSPGDPPRRTG